MLLYLTLLKIMGYIRLIRLDTILEVGNVADHLLVSQN